MNELPCFCPKISNFCSNLRYNFSRQTDSGAVEQALPAFATAWSRHWGALKLENFQNISWFIGSNRTLDSAKWTMNHEGVPL